MIVIRGTVGHAGIGLGGLLGYRDDMADGRMALPAGVDTFDHSVSAHAPSDPLVELREPTDVRGVLNAGANFTFHDNGPCQFWVNDHRICELSLACEPTPWILPRHIPPPRNTGAPPLGGLSVWVARKGDHGPFGRLALVTVGCYPAEGVKPHAQAPNSSKAFSISGDTCCHEGQSSQSSGRLTGQRFKASCDLTCWLGKNSMK